MTVRPLTHTRSMLSRKLCTLLLVRRCPWYTPRPKRLPNHEPMQWTISVFEDVVSVTDENDCGSSRNYLLARHSALGGVEVGSHPLRSTYFIFKGGFMKETMFLVLLFVSLGVAESPPPSSSVSTISSPAAPSASAPDCRIQTC